MKRSQAILACLLSSVALAESVPVAMAQTTIVDINGSQVHIQMPTPPDVSTIPGASGTGNYQVQVQIPTPPTMPKMPTMPTMPTLPAAPETSSTHVQGMTVTSTGQNATASASVGGIGQGVDIQGVAVINGQVWIDGDKIPEDVRHYKSKSGQNYAIERTPSGASVHTE
ncbi:MAG: hypothetical protein HQL37_03865 [Alphaproteobacteria bacterium]|nr:hypothetical protein [Alphaproteobacteria bacterium]